MWLIFKAGFVAGFFNGLVVWAGNRMREPEDDHQSVQGQNGDSANRGN